MPVVLLSDAGPLITLAYADALDLLFKPGIWRLSPGDADYPIRWLLSKAGFSRRLDTGEHRRPSRVAKRERGIWQRRYWEHQIRDDADLARHVA